MPSAPKSVGVNFSRSQAVERRLNDLEGRAMESYNRFQHGRRMADLDDTISLWRAELLELGRHAGSRTLLVLSNIGTALMTHHELFGTTTHLEEAIVILRKALSLCPAGNPNRGDRLDHLGIAVFARFQLLGNTEDLIESVDLCREGLSLHPKSHPSRGRSLCNLAAGVSTKFQQNGHKEDLIEAIDLLREGLLLCPRGHPGREKTLTQLASVVFRRFQQLGNMEDLVEMIDLLRDALTLHPKGDPNRGTSLANLASAIFTRFQQQGDTVDLAEAISLYREALSTLQEGHRGRAAGLTHLAAAVTARFMHQGRTEDLVEGINLRREALSLHPKGHPHRAAALTNLATAIVTRYHSQSNAEDLAEAINLFRETLSLVPKGSPERGRCLGNFATAIWEHGRPEDLAETIELLRETLSLHPKGHTRRRSTLNNLASALESRYEKEGSVVDLDEAVALRRENLSFTTHGHPEYPQLLAKLAHTLATLPNAGMDELSEALALARRGTKILPPNHPLEARQLDQYAKIWLMHARLCRTSGLPCVVRAKRQGSRLTFGFLCRETPGARDGLLDALQKATALDGSSLLDRFAVAVDLIEYSNEDDTLKDPHSSVASARTVAAYATALDLLNSCVVTTRSLQARVERLSGESFKGVRHLAHLAAAAAISRGNLSLAVELLEQGRATLLSQVGRYRVALGGLGSSHAELVRRFDELSHQLERATMAVDGKESAKISFDDEASRYSTSAFCFMRRSLTRTLDTSGFRASGRRWSMKSELSQVTNCS